MKLSIFRKARGKFRFLVDFCKDCNKFPKILHLATRKSNIDFMACHGGGPKLINQTNKLVPLPMATETNKSIR